jgi:hypothetical protein
MTTFFCENKILFDALQGIASLLAMFFAVMAYILSRKVRKDNLWDKRYSFYIEAEKFWKESAPESAGGTRNIEWDDLEYLALKAEFLFGEGISTHIKSYAKKSYNSHVPWVPDQEFLKPFRTFLKL